MGKELTSARAESRDPSERHQFRQRVQRGFEALNYLWKHQKFASEEKQIGLEVELNLADQQRQPAPWNVDVLTKLDNPCFTTEVARYNLEINVPHRTLSGDSLFTLEQDLLHFLKLASDAASRHSATIAMIGILPTVTEKHFAPEYVTNKPRYLAMNQAILAARDGAGALAINGSNVNPEERLRCALPSVSAAGGATSTQFHIQVSAHEFASYWNAAQCLAGPQAAMGVNSPFLAGKTLWDETRIPLFEQAADTRSRELKNQQVRQRVCFGDRWITSPIDLFLENLRYFPALLIELGEQDPLTAAENGDIPALAELMLHNGTIWRWNRPVYDVSNGTPHFRVENRVVTAGPTALDTIANAAFFYGAQQSLANDKNPLWDRMSFAMAKENFYAAARDGFRSTMFWPGFGHISPSDLIMRVLLPKADEGLAQSGVPSAVRDRYLNVIRERCISQQTGAQWQRETVRLAEERGKSREDALVHMLNDYLQLSATEQPVHQWPLATKYASTVIPRQKTSEAIKHAEPRFAIKKSLWETEMVIPSPSDNHTRTHVLGE